MKYLFRFFAALMFLSSAPLVMGQSSSFEELDADKNGVLSPQEFAAFGAARNVAFSSWDVDGDGSLSKAEFERGSLPTASGLPTRPGGARIQDIIRPSRPPAANAPAATAPAPGAGVARDGAPAASPPPPGPPSGAPVARMGRLTVVRASRLFAGPQDYPPTDFAAYGIVAFRFLANDVNRTRYMAICEGFLAALPAAADLQAQGVPLGEQMGTVWPVNESSIAQRLNRAAIGARSDSCAEATSAIDLATSLNAIAAAKEAHPDAEFDRDGPYLLAWSPSSTKGSSDALVLVFDLTDVTTLAEAMRRFGDWAVEIEDPESWRGGWDNAPFRIKLRQLADKYGEAILRVLGSIGGN